VWHNKEQSASLWTKTKTHLANQSKAAPRCAKTPRKLAEDQAAHVGQGAHSPAGRGPRASPGAPAAAGPGVKGGRVPSAPPTKTTFDPAASGAVTAAVGTHLRASGGCRGRRGPRRGPTCPKTGPFCTLEWRTARPACAVLILPPLLARSLSVCGCGGSAFSLLLSRCLVRCFIVCGISAKSSRGSGAHRAPLLDAAVCTHKHTGSGRRHMGGAGLVLSAAFSLMSESSSVDYTRYVSCVERLTNFVNFFSFNMLAEVLIICDYRGVCNFWWFLNRWSLICDMKKGKDFSGTI
jgi:hypothetical protein